MPSAAGDHPRRRATDFGDTNVLDRDSLRATRASNAAVRAWRRGEANARAAAAVSANPHEGEILRRHARRILDYRFFTLTLLLLVAGIAALTFDGLVAGAWAAAAIATSAVAVRLAQTILKEDGKPALPSTLERGLLLNQALHGGLWAALFSLHPVLAGADGFQTVLSAGALLLLGYTLLTQHDLRHGIAATMALPMLAACGRLSMTGSIVAIAEVAVLLAACLLALRLGDRLRANLVGHLQDQAERDRLILELESARQTSEEARRRAEEANLAKSRFLATMSHELRTPLNAILGFSEVMKDEVMGPLENEFYRDYANDIHNSGTHLLKLINEILDLSRVEAGRYELHEEAASLTHAAQESQQMLKVKAQDKGIELVVQTQPGLPPVWADARAMRQVILNLLSNALKFTPVGGTVWLKVGWTAAGGQYISVRDNGPGISEEEIPVVLSSFGQGSIAIKSAEQGTGLGLPIVQALVQMHDGTFTLRSKLREGTEGIAVFPRNRVLDQMTATAVPANQRKRVMAPPMAPSLRAMPVKG